MQRRADMRVCAEWDGFSKETRRYARLYRLRYFF